MTKKVGLKVAFDGAITSLSILRALEFEEFVKHLKDLYKIPEKEVITIKWIDDEQDVCTVSSQLEFEEIVRLRLSLDDFDCVLTILKGEPTFTGGPCPGDDKLFRIGAKRWKKLKEHNYHLFQERIIPYLSSCSVCGEKIWGFGRNGYKCITCKLLVHKRCYRKVDVPCTHLLSLSNGSSGYAEGRGSNMVEDADANRVIVPSRDPNLNGIECSPESPIKILKDEPYPYPENKAELDDFDFIRVIGRGSYAKVMLVRRKKSEEFYALKIIRKEIFLDDDVDWVKSERRIFELAAGNPFLVSLHSTFQTPTRLFFVIEYVGGGDLMYHMQRRKFLPENDAKFYSAEIAYALNFLHEKFIVYRDLKLDNILINYDGHVKLTDFGMCKEGDGPNFKTNTFCGTPNYIAPEVLLGEDYGFTVDWWALGVLTFEMLAGRSPFDIVYGTDNINKNTEEYLFQTILQKEVRIPRSFSIKSGEFIRALLCKNPKKRLGCCNEHFEDLKNHIFFKGLPWDDLIDRRIKPPFTPTISRTDDIDNFDPLFTREPVQFTPDDPSTLMNIDQSAFIGFDYINLQCDVVS